MADAHPNTRKLARACGCTAKDHRPRQLLSASATPANEKKKKHCPQGEDRSPCVYKSSVDETSQYFEFGSLSQFCQCTHMGHIISITISYSIINTITITISYKKICVYIIINIIILSNKKHYEYEPTGY